MGPNCQHIPSEDMAKVVCSGPEVIKLFSCSTQLSIKFQLLIKTQIAQMC